MKDMKEQVLQVTKGDLFCPLFDKSGQNIKHPFIPFISILTISFFIYFQYYDHYWGYMIR